MNDKELEDFGKLPLIELSPEEAIAEEKRRGEIQPNGSCLGHQDLTIESGCNCGLEPQSCEYKNHTECESCNDHAKICKNFRVWLNFKNGIKEEG